MSTPADHADTHFLDVAAALGAVPGDHGFHRGILDKTAFLCKLVPADPARQVFRLRMTEEHHVPSTWINSLPEAYRNSGLTCKVDGRHLELSVPEPTRYPPRDIVTLVRDCIRHHALFFPPTTHYCYDCGDQETVTLEQSGSTIATVCADCLGKRPGAQPVAPPKRDKSGTARLALLPFAPLLSATGWAVFWLIFDILEAKDRIGALWFPWLMALAIILGGGFGLGWLTGILLRRARATGLCPLRPLAIVVTGTAVVAGEIIATTIMVYRLTGSIDIPQALGLIIPYSLTQNILYTGAKLIFATVMAYAIYRSAGPQGSRIRR